MEKTPGRCASGACVDITETGGEYFLATSTIEGNDGSVLYTAAEMATFLSDVKAGKWDELHARARQLSEPKVSTSA